MPVIVKNIQLFLRLFPVPPGIYTAMFKYFRYCTVYTSTVHLNCTPQLYTSTVHLDCTPRLYTSTVHLNCKPRLCTIVQLYDGKSLQIMASGSILQNRMETNKESTNLRELAYVRLKL